MKYDVFKDKYQLLHKDVIPALKKLDNYSELPKLLGKLENCGSFVKTINCKNCDTSHFNGLSGYCHNKLCPVCSRLRSDVWFSKLGQVAEWLRQHGYYVTFLTLTIKNVDSLELALKQLRDSWRYMTAGSKELRKEFKKLQYGGFKSLEIKLGKNSKMWHTHLHCLLVKKFAVNDVKLLADLWGKATKAVIGTACRLDLKTIKSNNDDGCVLGAIREVCKYITKNDLMSIPKDRLIEMITCLKGIRQYSTWGILHQLSSEVDVEVKEMDKLKLDKFKCIICGFTKYTSNYVSTAKAIRLGEAFADLPELERDVVVVYENKHLIIRTTIKKENIISTQNASVVHRGVNSTLKGRIFDG